MRAQTASADARPSSCVPSPVQAPQNQLSARPCTSGKALLRDERAPVEDRMGVVELAVHRRRCRLLDRVERDDHRHLERQALQTVGEHVHADRRRLAGRIARRLVVPRRPGRLAQRQDADVGVQDGAVALVVKGAEHLALVGARVGEERQRIDAVASEDDGVEALACRGRSRRRRRRSASRFTRRTGVARRASASDASMRRT